MENVYIFFEDCSKADQDKVIVHDVATVLCSDKKLQSKINAIKIYTFHGEENRIILTSLKILDLILSAYPDITITPIGSTDILIEKNTSAPKKSFQILKVAILCLIAFFGAGFTIMAFNNDVQVHNVFSQIYTWLTGKESSGFTLLEISYCIGLGAGILIFYNHFGKKKLSRDPTPLEIEMRLYEDDIHTTLVEGVKRKNKHIDVD